MTIRLARSDGLPEGANYPDEGCDLHPFCLTCPLPACRYDSLYRVDILRADLRARVMHSRRSQGASVAEIMRELGVSRRTVFHLMRRTVSNVAMSRSQQVLPEGGARGA